MSALWEGSVNQTLGLQRLNPCDFVTSANLNRNSPIDSFYARRTQILALGTPQQLGASDSLGPLLLVGIVSATEHYFRSVFSVAINICRICAKKSADQKISLGSVVWHGQQDVARGALEHLSLADAQVIRSNSEKFLGFKIPNASDTSSALDEFDKICQLRHGIVHNASELPGSNAVKLELNRSNGLPKIKVEYSELQMAASVCTALIASFNRELFSELARRWATQWTPQKNHAAFKVLWTSFHSTQDAANQAITTPLSMIKCRNRISAQFS